MVSKAALRAAEAQLAQAGVEDAGYDAGELFYEATGRRASPVDERPLSEQEEQRFWALIARRAAREPLQYLCKSWGFYDIELAVGPGVLIPRPDTETVAEQALAMISGVKAPRVLDLCAGTGAIGCAVAHRRPDAEVFCVELSADAMPYLQKNAARWGTKPVLADVTDFWQTLTAGSVDLVVSNPPYVTEQEYRLLAPELAFEPKMALVAQENGLAFYKAIAAGYKAALRAGGALCVEIGAGQAADVCSIFAQNGYTEIGVVQDFGALDRCVHGRKDR